jgi:predicted PurR-regulated permease PerM
MIEQAPIHENTVTKSSLILFGLFLVAVSYFGLAALFITVLFSMLCLTYLGRYLSKAQTIITFGLLVILLFYVFVHFAGQAILHLDLPRKMADAVPQVVSWADRLGVDLPFSDPEGLRSYVLDQVKDQTDSIAKFAKITTEEFVYVVMGLVVACGIFASGRIDLEKGSHALEGNLYSIFTDKLAQRFSRFFQSFHTVMGAQLVISLINTTFTGAFLFALHLFHTPIPYSFVLVVVTFLCGLLPVIGNLISNSVIFSVALTQSTTLAVAALLYLIFIHKVEYFLNSKIIGGRIKNPMWLTLLGLLVGNKIAGIPGMILAPVILNYLKVEGTKIAVTPRS